jgi:hypothetical protein
MFSLNTDRLPVADGLVFEPFPPLCRAESSANCCEQMLERMDDIYRK